MGTAATPSAPLPVATSPAWHLRLLGTFELTAGPQRHGKLATRATMALLVRLALRPGSAHPREELVELLWPDVAPEAGRQRLRQALSTLKQVLEPAGQATGQLLEADRLALRLRPGSVDCDVLAFEAAFKRGAHDEARALYAGDFMPGFFDEWISDERLRLEGLFDRLRPPATAAVAEASSAAAPTSSPPWSPPNGPAPRHALPAYLTRLVGADAAIEQLHQAVAANRLVTLLGPGGAGKTRLAVETARAWPAQALGGAGSAAPKAAEPVFDTVVFVPLAACRSRAQVLDQLLLSLHLPSTSAGPLAALAQALEARPVLLLLDNFEQAVDEAAELVAELMARLPQLHVLATSRRVLDIPGECALQVASLAQPAADAAVPEAALYPAVALFVDRARAARAEFHLHEGNRQAVIQLVQALEGMPLAIELAAARVRSMAPADLAAALQRARDRAPGPSATQPGALDLLARAPQRGRQDTRHHSMRDTIDWSWQLLAPQQRTLMARLTVFQGSFNAGAAQAVCAVATDAAAPPGTQHPCDTAVALQLDELLSHSMLRVVAAGDAPDTLRFSLYEPIREFASRKLSEAEAAGLRQGLRAWAVAWGLAMPATPPLAALRGEWPNLSAALVSAVEDGEPARALDIALALRPALEYVVLPSAGQAALRAALAACGGAPGHTAALLVLAVDLLRSGQGVEGRDLAQQALAQADASQPELRARALLTLALIDFNTGGRSPQLLDHLKEARALAQTTDHQALQARAAGVLADLTGMVAGDLAGAEALHAQALAGWLAQGNQLAALRTRFALAQLADAAGRHPDVLALLGPVIDSARKLQAWSILAPSLNVQGETLAALRQWPAALAASREALDTAWRGMDTWNTLLPLFNLHVALAHTGHPALAQQVAGYISHSWVQRFGSLNPRAVWALRRSRRLACVQLGPVASRAAFAEGQGSSLADIVARVLQVVQALAR